jgi:hypothetical protein
MRNLQKTERLSFNQDWLISLSFCIKMKYRLYGKRIPCRDLGDDTPVHAIIDLPISASAVGADSTLTA